MTYLRVKWMHDLPDEPVILVSEIDDARWEVRKVEVYRDGRRGWAGGGREAGGTKLGEVPVPPLAEIARDPQFVPIEIEAHEFEAEWALRGGG